jgi:hypothetical protein
LQRTFHVAFVVARGAPADERLGKVRLDPDSLVVFPQRALNVTFGAACNATADERLGKVRLEPDSLVVIPQRALNITFGAACNGPIVVGGKVRLSRMASL